MRINGKEVDFRITNLRHAAAYEKALEGMRVKEVKIKEIAKETTSVIPVYEAFIRMIRDFFKDATGTDVLDGCEDFAEAKKVYMEFLAEINLQKKESLSMYSAEIK